MRLYEISQKAPLQFFFQVDAPDISPHKRPRLDAIKEGRENLIGGLTQYRLVDPNLRLPVPHRQDASLPGVPGEFDWSASLESWLLVACLPKHRNRSREELASRSKL
jgi:hypothetical protein